MMRYPDCPACRGAQGDPELHRLEVWSDDLWRLTTAVWVVAALTVVFARFLQPKQVTAD